MSKENHLGSMGTFITPTAIWLARCSYLGFLGFAGLLGFLPHAQRLFGLTGFFGFFGFFGFAYLAEAVHRRRQ